MQHIETVTNDEVKSSSKKAAALETAVSNACCSETKQAACCEPSEKSECCGTPAATESGTCGCQ